MIKVNRAEFELACENNVETMTELSIILMGVVDCTKDDKLLKSAITTAFKYMCEDFDEKDFLQFLSKYKLKFPEYLKDEMKGS